MHLSLLSTAGQQHTTLYRTPCFLCLAFLSCRMLTANQFSMCSNYQWWLLKQGAWKQNFYFYSLKGVETWWEERGRQKTKTWNSERSTKCSFPLFGLWCNSLELHWKTVVVVTIQRLFFHLTFCSMLLLFSIAMPKFLLFILIVLVCLTLIGLYV